MNKKEMQEEIEELKRSVVWLLGRQRSKFRWEIVRVKDGYLVYVGGQNVDKVDTWAEARQLVFDIRDKHMPPRIQPKQSRWVGTVN